MAELVKLEQHMDTELPTVATQATTEWVYIAVLALVYLQEDGLGVHLSVDVIFVIKLI